MTFLILCGDNREAVEINRRFPQASAVYAISIHAPLASFEGLSLSGYDETKLARSQVLPPGRRERLVHSIEGNILRTTYSACQ